MRIHAEERTVIRKVLHAYFGDQARIILFGSRTNDQARGGDIDLLVETNIEQTVQALNTLYKHWPRMEAMYAQVRGFYLARRSRGAPWPERAT